MKMDLNILLPQLKQQEDEQLLQQPLHSLAAPSTTHNNNNNVQTESKQTDGPSKNHPTAKKKINYFNMNDVLESITSESSANTNHLSSGEIQVRNPSPSKRQTQIGRFTSPRKGTKVDRSTFRYVNILIFI
jgi:hypothetical protein